MIGGGWLRMRRIFGTSVSSHFESPRTHIRSTRVTLDHTRRGGDGSQSAAIPGTSGQVAFADYGAPESRRICKTSYCDRDVGLAESGYLRFVPLGQKSPFFNSLLE